LLGSALPAARRANLTALCPAASRNDIPPQFSGLVGFDNIFVAMVTVRRRGDKPLPLRRAFRFAPKNGIAALVGLTGERAIRPVSAAQVG
jgi:hypothetical protein